jgi:hypothetical protein
MINVHSLSAHVTAYRSGTSPWVSAGSDHPARGQTRYVNDRLEVWDGGSWIHIVNNITVAMNPMAESALTWAMERQAQEQQWAKLAQSHAAVADALEDKRRADQALAVVTALCNEFQENNQGQK